MAYMLKPTFQTYAWGDRHYLQQLCNLEEKLGQPMAEMWLGAHPQSPSLLISDDGAIALNRFLDTDPQFYLGSAATLYHQQLPFLLKVLAAEQPLSIQVHPDKFTAENGFLAENMQGIEMGNSFRTFKDDNHKPELLCALTDFTAMCGFRPFKQIVSLFSAFSLQLIWPLFAVFADKPDPDTLQELFRQILDSDLTDLQQFLACLNRADCSDDADLEFVKTICLQLNRHHSFDSGIVSPLLLNTFTLKPGQAIFLEAGMIHAYIKGAGVEIMANSDNVIRGGLTPKHIDKAKLFAITSFQPHFPQIIQPEPAVNELVLYSTPAEEFALAHLTLKGDYLYQPQNRPAILLCLAGQGIANEELEFSQGTAIFVPACESQLILRGSASLYLATSKA